MEGSLFEEIWSVEKNSTWEITDQPGWKRPVGCKGIISVKQNANGSITRFKARLATKSHTILWLERMLRELKVPVDIHLVLQYDNKTAINITKNLVHHKWTKHVEIDRHFIREMLEEGLIKLVYISTNYQITDILTNAPPWVSFDSLKSKLHMIDIHS